MVMINPDLRLEPVSREFSQEVFENFTEDIIEFLPLEEPPAEIEETIAFIDQSVRQREKGTDLVWVILFKNSFAGCCGIHGITSGEPHFGLWVKKGLQGRGIGKQLVPFMLQWAVKELDIDFIKYPVDRRNTKSLSLLKGLDVKLATSYREGEKKRLYIDEYRFYKTAQ